MFNYNNTFAEENTIACANNGIKIEAHGTGHYEQKAAIIKVVLAYDGLELRQVGRKYEILWDGQKMNSYSSLEIAESYFRDFTGLKPARYAKMKAAQLVGE